MTGDEVSAIRSYLDRRWELTPAARAQVGSELASRLVGKVSGVPMHEGPERFLEWIVLTKLSR